MTPIWKCVLYFFLCCSFVLLAIHVYYIFSASGPSSPKTPTNNANAASTIKGEATLKSLVLENYEEVSDHNDLEHKYETKIISNEPKLTKFNDNSNNAQYSDLFTQTTYVPLQLVDYAILSPTNSVLLTRYSTSFLVHKKKIKNKQISAEDEEQGETRGIAAKKDDRDTEEELKNVKNEGKKEVKVKEEKSTETGENFEVMKKHDLDSEEEYEELHVQQETIIDKYLCIPTLQIINAVKEKEGDDFLLKLLPQMQVMRGITQEENENDSKSSKKTDDLHEFLNARKLIGTSFTNAFISESSSCTSPLAYTFAEGHMPLLALPSSEESDRDAIRTPLSAHVASSSVFYFSNLTATITPPLRLRRRKITTGARQITVLPASSSSDHLSNQ